MRVRTAFLFLVVLLIAGLAFLNWTALSTPTSVSLGFTTVSAPLGLIMLSLTAALAVFFLIYLIYMQSAALMETRRQSRELATQRELADRAEASRFTDLRTFLESQEQKRNARATELHNAALARSDQSDHTLAAHVGQLEDRLDRLNVGREANQPVLLPPDQELPLEGEREVSR
ncbi:MAG: LapA family protein [Variovorax sp.]